MSYTTALKEDHKYLQIADGIEKLIHEEVL